VRRNSEKHDGMDKSDESAFPICEDAELHPIQFRLKRVNRSVTDLTTACDSDHEMDAAPTGMDPVRPVWRRSNRGGTIAAI
jgi:hypothetical protein